MSRMIASGPNKANNTVYLLGWWEMTKRLPGKSHMRFVPRILADEQNDDIRVFWNQGSEFPPNRFEKAEAFREGKEYTWFLSITNFVVDIILT